MKDYYLIVERVEDGLISKVKIEKMGHQYNTDRIDEVYNRHRTAKDALLEDYELEAQEKNAKEKED